MSEERYQWVIAVWWTMSVFAVIMGVGLAIVESQYWWKVLPPAAISLLLAFAETTHYINTGERKL